MGNETKSLSLHDTHIFVSSPLSTVHMAEMDKSPVPEDTRLDIGKQALMDGVQLLVEHRAVATGDLGKVLLGDAEEQLVYEFEAGSVQQYLTRCFFQRLQESGLETCGHITVEGCCLRVTATPNLDSDSATYGQMVVRTVRNATVSVSPEEGSLFSKCAQCASIIHLSEDNGIKPTCGHTICKTCWTSRRFLHAEEEVRRLVWYYVRAGLAQTLSPKTLHRIVVDKRAAFCLELHCDACNKMQLFNGIGQLGRGANTEYPAQRCRMTPGLFLRIMQLSEENVLRHAGLVECYSGLVEAATIDI